MKYSTNSVHFQPSLCELYQDSLNFFSLNCCKLFNSAKEHHISCWNFIFGHEKLALTDME